MLSDPENMLLKSAVSSINFLSDDCLDYILSFIPTLDLLLVLSTVCKRWHFLCLQRLSRLKVLDTRNLSIEKSKEKIKETIIYAKNVIRILTLNIGTLQHLHIDNNVYYTIYVDTPKSKSRSIPETSSKSECNILLIVSEYCPNLKTLSLNIDERHHPFKLQIPESLPNNLNSLSLNCGNQLESKGLLAKLLEKTKSLQMLDLGPLNGKDKFSDIFRAIRRHQIRCLSFKQCTNLNQTDMAVLLETFYSSVEDLSFTNPNSLEDMITNQEISSDQEKKFYKLKRFQASQKPHCNAIRLSMECGKFNVQLLNLMPNLEVLDLSSTRHRFDLISTVVRGCPLLKRFHFNECEFTVKQLTPLQQLTHLEHLDISYSFNTFYRNWLNVVDKVLVRIQSLKYIDLRGTTIDDNALHQLMEAHHNLETIDVSDALTVTGVLLEMLHSCNRDKVITIIDRPVRTSAGVNSLSALEWSRRCDPDQIRIPEWFRLNGQDVFSWKVEEFWKKSLKLCS